MTMFTQSSSMKIVPLLILLTVAGCNKEPTVSYAQDIKPIIDTYCIECHQAGGAGEVASGFSMASYADLMRGTRNGPMVIAGDSLGSNMLVLMEGRADPSIKMPHGKSVSASKAELDTLRLWIDQGARDN
jgi:hypothetical protein